MWFNILLLISPRRALLRANSLHVKGKNQAAILAYKRLIHHLSKGEATRRSNDQNILGRAYVELGHLYWELADKPSATACYQQARESGITDTDSATRLANLFFEQHRYADVQSLLESGTSRTGTQSLILGRSYLATGRPVEAIAQLITASKQMPDRWEPAYYLGCAYGYAEDYSKAEQQFSRLIAHLPRCTPAYVQRGHVHLKSGKLKHAWKDYEKAEEIGAGDSVAAGYECLGLIYSRQGEHEKAARLLTRAKQLGRCTDALLFQLGWSSYCLGQLSKCVDYWQALEGRYPQRAWLKNYISKAKYLLAARHAAENSWAAVVEALTEYLKTNPHPEVERVLAEAHFRVAANLLRNPACRVLEARIHLEKVRCLMPQDHRAPHYLALLAAKAGDMALAITMMRRAAAKWPQEPCLTYELALLLCQTGNWTEGLSLLHELSEEIEGSEWTERARLALGASYISGGRWDEAADILMLQDESNVGSTPPERYSLLAASLLHAGRLGELLSVRSEDEQVLYYQSCGLMDAGRTVEAINLLRRALRDGGSTEAARNLLANALCAAARQGALAGDWKGTAAAIREAISLEPEWCASLEWDTDLVNAFALVFLLAGERAEATALWERLQRSEPLSTSHLLLIAAFCETARNGEPAQNSSAFNAWQRVIRNAAMLLHDELFWKDWAILCQERFGSKIDSQAVSGLQNRLGLYLKTLLPITTPLGVELRSELEAARTLKQAGGLNISASSEQIIICGYQMIQSLHYEQELGQFIRYLITKEAQAARPMIALEQLLSRYYDIAPPPTALEAEHIRKLLRYFSSLRGAQVLLESGHPRKALEALTHACCQHCARIFSRDNFGAEWIPSVCVEGCRSFNADNPAYSKLDNRGKRLWQDAVNLAIEAYMGMADGCITSVPMNLEEASNHWEQALNLSDIARVGTRTQRALVERVSGRVTALIKQGQFDDAIDLLENVLELCDETFQGELGGQLAETLSYRGVRALKESTPEWEAALSDFRRAVELNPYVPLWLQNLAITLRRYADDLFDQDPQKARELLMEALFVLKGGLLDFPNDEGLTRQMNELTFDIMLSGAMKYSDPRLSRR